MPPPDSVALLKQELERAKRDREELKEALEREHRASIEKERALERELRSREEAYADREAYFRRDVQRREHELRAAEQELEQRELKLRQDAWERQDSERQAQLESDRHARDRADSAAAVREAEERALRERRTSHVCDFLCTTQRELACPCSPQTALLSQPNCRHAACHRGRAEPPSRHESHSEADSIAADEREVTRRLSRFSQRQLADACRDPNTPADIRAIAVRFLIPEYRKRAPDDCSCHSHTS